MGKFSPTTLNGDCEEIANPSTAYGRRRRNWIDAHGSVPAGQVVDASCGNKHCRMALRHSYLRQRVEQPRKYPKIAKRVHRLKIGQHFDVPGSVRMRGAATDFARDCMPLCGWTRFQYVGSRMGMCASRKSGNGLASDSRCWRGFKAKHWRLNA
jgi:hypothetical protein